MVNIKLANSWLIKNAQFLPAYLGYFNIAGLMIRNQYLGHLIGDENIDSLLSFAQRFGKAGCKAVRIGGNDIINFFDSELEILELNSAYSRTDDFTINYKIISALDVNKTEKRVSRKTKFFLNLHCVYTELKPENYFEDIIKDMIDLVHLCTPNTPKRLEDVKYYLPLPEPIRFEKLSDLSKEIQEEVIKSINSRWNCIEDPLNFPHMCLSCNGTSFDWLDKSFGFSVEGVCKNCGAKYSFSCL